MNKLLLAFICYLIGQIVVWFVSNAQFMSKWAATHPWTIAIVVSIPTSYLFIIATKYSAEYFDGLVWPGRLIGFGIGMICFAFLTNYILGESMTMKTLISLMLATTLVCIQVFWK